MKGLEPVTNEILFLCYNFDFDFCLTSVSLNGTFLDPMA